MEIDVVNMLLNSGSGAFVGYLMYKLAKEELKEVKIALNKLENEIVKLFRDK